MTTYPLTLHNGHLFLTIDQNSWLLDTGAPESFGNQASLNIAGKSFEVPPNHFMLNAEELSKLVGHPTSGLIGADILTQFNTLIDVKSKEISFSQTNAFALDGDVLNMEEFMGIPIVNVTICGSVRRMFFDTGAQISYFQGDELQECPPAGTMTDFFPGFGQFNTETYMVETSIGSLQFELRCGSLPGLLGATLMMAGTEGIIGNEILINHTVAYSPRNKTLIIGS